MKIYYESGLTYALLSNPTPSRIFPSQILYFKNYDQMKVLGANNNII